MGQAPGKASLPQGVDLFAVKAKQTLSARLDYEIQVPLTSPDVNVDLYPRDPDVGSAFSVYINRGDRITVPGRLIEAVALDSAQATGPFSQGTGQHAYLYPAVSTKQNQLSGFLGVEWDNTGVNGAPATGIAVFFVVTTTNAILTANYNGVGAVPIDGSAAAAGGNGVVIRLPVQLGDTIAIAGGGGVGISRCVIVSAA